VGVPVGCAEGVNVGAADGKDVDGVAVEGTAVGVAVTVAGCSCGAAVYLSRQIPLTKSAGWCPPYRQPGAGIASLKNAAGIAISLNPRLAPNSFVPSEIFSA
jgi:hypothetical protein